jgi:LacI family transcriptional regulator
LTKNLTINDLASKLNLSIATVSRALRNKNGISEITKLNVLNAAKELDYRPNFWAKSLVNHQSNIIALLVPDLNNCFYRDIVDSFYSIAEYKGLNILLFVTGKNQKVEQKQIIRILSYNPLGIVSISTINHYETQQILLKKDSNVVLIDPNTLNGNFNSVKINHSNSVYDAISKSIKHGYDKFACFCDETNVLSENQKFSGFINALIDHNKELNPLWINYSKFSYNELFTILNDLLKCNHLPEMIFSSNEDYSLKLFSILKKLNLIIPEDIDLICYGDGIEHSIYDSAYCVIKQPIEEITENALNIILRNFSEKSECNSNISLMSNKVFRVKPN